MTFDVIYADCPWKYNSRANHKTRFRGGADGHYPLLSFRDIAELPIADLANANCALFLWCTFPFLEDQLTLFKKWGFRYTTLGFSWMKTNPKNGKPFFGVGYYGKSNMEVCLLGIKGRMKPDTNKVSSMVIAPRMQHSAKPEEVRRRIELLYPEASKIELFARIQAPGWTAIGLDITGNDIRKDLEIINAKIK